MLTDLGTLNSLGLLAFVLKHLFPWVCKTINRMPYLRNEYLYKLLENFSPLLSKWWIFFIKLVVNWLSEVSQIIACNCSENAGSVPGWYSVVEIVWSIFIRSNFSNIFRFLQSFRSFGMTEKNGYRPSTVWREGRSRRTVRKTKISPSPSLRKRGTMDPGYRRRYDENKGRVEILGRSVESMAGF